MKLSRTTDFAMRVLMYLARRPQDSFTTNFLADELDIPYNNLTKIIQSLVKAGVVVARKGKNGGITLGKPPEDIRLKTVIHTFDGPTQLSECLVDAKFCSQVGCCKLQTVFHDIQTKIDQLFNDVTIASLVE